jgi:hypothetical protein
MNVTRRGFLAGLAAIVAVHQLPRRLTAPKKMCSSSFAFLQSQQLELLDTNLVQPLQAVNAYQAYGANVNSGAMYTKLYELDPYMFMTIDLRGVTINITTRADRGQVTSILWKYKPIGVLAIVNGTRADFSEHWKKCV